MKNKFLLIEKEYSGNNELYIKTFFKAIYNANKKILVFYSKFKYIDSDMSWGDFNFRNTNIEENKISYKDAITKYKNLCQIYFFIDILDEK